MTVMLRGFDHEDEIVRHDENEAEGERGWRGIGV